MDVQKRKHVDIFCNNNKSGGWNGGGGREVKMERHHLNIMV